MLQQMKKAAIQLWKDESAQGATEYILLLVVVLAIAGLFRERIMEAVSGRLDAVSNSLGNFNVNQ